MDQDTLHELGKGAAIRAQDGACGSPRPSALYCPTRRGGQAYPYCAAARPSGSTGPVTMAGRTDYAINGGSVIPIAERSGPHQLDRRAVIPGPASRPAEFQRHRHRSQPDHRGHDSRQQRYDLPCRRKVHVAGELHHRRRHHASQNDPGDLYQRDVGRRRQPDSLGQRPPCCRAWIARPATILRPQLRHRSSAVRTAPAGMRPFATATCS